MSTAHVLAVGVFGTLVVGYFWSKRERAKEQEQERTFDRESLYDVIARHMARDLDDEWARLATLACRDWPADEDAS